MKRNYENGYKVVSRDSNPYKRTHYPQQHSDPQNFQVNQYDYSPSYGGPKDRYGPPPQLPLVNVPFMNGPGIDQLREYENELNRREDKINRTAERRDRDLNKRFEHLEEWEKHIMELFRDTKYPVNSNKSKMCRHRGDCRFKNCKFAHNKEELSVPYKLYWCKFGKSCSERDCVDSHSKREWLKYHSYNTGSDAKGAQCLEDLHKEQSESLRELLCKVRGYDKKTGPLSTKE